MWDLRLFFINGSIPVQSLSLLFVLLFILTSFEEELVTCGLHILSTLMSQQQDNRKSMIGKKRSGLQGGWIGV